MSRKPAIEMSKTWNKNLDVGATLEGEYVKKEIVNFNYGETEKYIIKTKDGEKYAVFASASLHSQFNNVPEGSYVWIEYKGEKQSRNGRPVKEYVVEYDDEYNH